MDCMKLARSRNVYLTPRTSSNPLGKVGSRPRLHALIVVAAWVISGNKPGRCQTNATAGLEPATSPPNLWNCDVPGL